MAKRRSVATVLYTHYSDCRSPENALAGRMEVQQLSRDPMVEATATSKMSKQLSAWNNGLQRRPAPRRTISTFFQPASFTEKQTAGCMAPRQDTSLRLSNYIQEFRVHVNIWLQSFISISCAAVWLRHRHCATCRHCVLFMLVRLGRTSRCTSPQRNFVHRAFQNFQMSTVPGRKVMAPFSCDNIGCANI